MERMPRFRWLSLALLLAAAAACASSATTSTSSAVATASGQPVYESRGGDPDGIGRWYMGREIARVMGYQGAAWLERPERVMEERPDEVVARMALRSTDTVGDIGAGTGYFSFRLAASVPQGRVYAVDVQPEMLDIIRRRSAELGVANVVEIQGAETDTNLPDACCEAVLMVDVYHELAFPSEMMQSIVRALKPGGRLILIEYRGENPAIPIRRLHKMTEAQARREMEAAGLVWRETLGFLPTQHFIVFEKPDAG